VHSASLATLPDNGVAAVWYGGSREGARDTQIYLSRFSEPEGSWQNPRPIYSKKIVERELGRYIKKLGNPVLYADYHGRLYILFVSVSFGGWSGSAINLAISDDQGASWGSLKRLVTSPFANVSTLVRNNPVHIKQGAILVPAYHEFVGIFSEALIIGSSGEVIDKVRMSKGRGYLQPAIAMLTENSGVALHRSIDEKKRFVGFSRTNDAGKTWSSVQPLITPNPDSSVSIISNGSGKLVAILNPISNGRNQLSIAVSTDEGSTWSIVHDLEKSPIISDRFSYPNIIRTSNGNYHVVYTYNRKNIAHVHFNEAWLQKKVANK